MTDPVDRAAVLEVVERELRDTGALDDAEVRGVLAAIRSLPSLPAGEVEHYEGCPERDGVAGCCVCDEMPAIIRPSRATHNKDTHHE